ncbi:polyribonucleotide nucleotidyltransferase [Candidatus Marinamargulisbacteria bacterium SCGC AG-343-D04]|nr:polyribonucleotide nucleotidyltransferase [Candidatus Marinamargulisbacteria bacterium SCGC AG-343-D04]
MNTASTEGNISNHTVSLSSGKMAKQANGSILLRVKDTVLLATATMSKKAKEGIDFLPLTIEFSEKMYSAGKIPGGFFKREARPSTNSTLIARLIDRPLRPSFPKGFHHDIQIVITVLSYDPTVSLDAFSIVAASAALSVSDIPFNGPVGAVLVGRIDGKYIINPSPEELKDSDIDLVVAGNKEAVLMVEAGAKEVSEDAIIEAILEGHKAIKETISLQEDLASKTSKEKITLPEPPAEYGEFKEKLNQFLGDKIEAFLTSGKSKEEVEAFLDELEQSMKDTFISDDDQNASLIQSVYNELKKEKIRDTIISKKIRVDGRKTDEVRSLAIETNVLPLTHGSSLFTRGETQSLGVLTLGTSIDEQIIDGLADSARSKYFFHYNFPPFSVGEVGMIRTGRRELGHGALAERALRPVLPSYEKFPYTIRLVSEILESNGSSSMASVCSGSLALMDAGAPITGSVSGIAMGLLIKGDDYIILSDIQGLEDHYGDMDFKVAGTTEGITALQLDIKVAGLSQEILQKSLHQAKEGRLFILQEMNKVISVPNSTLSEHAPKIHTFNINPEKVGMIIGPGGKMIRKIEEESGATVTIADGNDGEITISSKSQLQLDKALSFINGLVKDPEVGDTFDGKVTKIVSFGAFIELVPGKEGLLHISRISSNRVENVEEYFKVGDSVPVKIEKVDSQNRINLDLINKK